MSTAAAVTTARSILAEMQAAVTARNVQRLDDLFDERAVLLGASAHSFDREGVRSYLTAVAEQPGALSWLFRDVEVFHEEPGVLGFATVGDIVLVEEGNEARAPFRLTVLAVAGESGWRIRQFHGSIPSDL